MRLIYIKRGFLTSMAVALVAAFVSCQQSVTNEHLDQEQVLSLRAMQVNFVEQGDENRSVSVGAGTRATEATFQSGDIIGVYLHTSSIVAQSTNHSSNMRYSTSDKGATWRAGNALGDKLVVGTTYYATAYYPHIPTISNTTVVAHSVAADQSVVTTADQAAGALEKSDFMVSAVSPLANVESATPSVNFVFSHVMTKLVVSISVPSVIDGAVVSKIKSISIDGTKLGSTINLASRAVAATGNVASITPRLIVGDGTAGKVATYEAIVVPQVVASGVQLVTIVCESNGGDKSLGYVVPNAAPLTLQGGKKVTLTLSSSADVTFTRELDLLDGLAKSSVEFGVKVVNGGAWTLTAPASGWIKLSTTTGGTPSYSISGTGTGAEQVVYVSVDANSAAGSVVREAALVLSCGSGATAVTASYTATQNYYKFGAAVKALAPLAGTNVMKVDPFSANQVWSATSDQTWLKMSNNPTYGEGSPAVSFGPCVGPLVDGGMYYHCDANNTAVNRVAVVSFKSTTVAAAPDVKHTITQAAPTMTLLPEAAVAVGKEVAATAVDLFTVTAPVGVKWKILSLTSETGTNKNMSLALSVATGAEQVGTGAAVSVKGTYSANAESASRFTNVVVSFATHATAQQKTVKVTQAAAGPPINPPTTSDYITIGSLKWTTGNLVASGTDGCKVGKPTDHGLYFQFGSLLGWKGGASGDGTGVCTKVNGTFFTSPFNAASEIHVKPALFTTIGNIAGTWPNQSVNLYYFGLSSYATSYAKLRDFAGFATGTLAASGVGDPCRYYLGGTWRLPTADEYKAMCNNYGGGSAPGSANAAWQGSPAGMNFNNNSTKLFIPASGYRNYSDGAIYYVGTNGYCWSESVCDAALGYNLYFYSGYVYPQNAYYRRNGFPVRCVQ